jgi:hypothetical protein
VPEGVASVVLHEPGLRGLQLEKLVAVGLFREFLLRLLELRGHVHPLGLEQAPVVGGDLGELLLRLRDRRSRALDRELLGLEVLFALDPLALLVGVHQPAGVAVLGELLEGLLLLPVVGKHLDELRLHFVRGGEVKGGLFEEGALLGERGLVSGDVRSVLRLRNGAKASASSPWVSVAGSRLPASK